jgi:uncharacterized MAPEG superfamily protein
MTEVGHGRRLANVRAMSALLPNSGTAPSTKASPDWYQRAVRAHMNCVETLPVYGAIVLTLVVTGLTSPFMDGISLTILVTRIGQTLVHIVLPPSNASASLRFALFSFQVVGMMTMHIMIVAYAI